MLLGIAASHQPVYLERTSNYADKTSTTIGFIGLGLIGGSIAKAIRQYYPDYQILAFDKSRETLALAMQDGTIDISCTAIDEQFSHCSYLFSVRRFLTIMRIYLS